MPYEVFRRSKYGGRKSPYPAIRCTKLGISFNKEAAEFLTCERVFLLLDLENHEAAARPTNDDAGFPVTRNKTTGQHTVSCQWFLRAAGLFNAGFIKAEWDADENILEWAIPEQPPSTNSNEQETK